MCMNGKVVILLGSWVKYVEGEMIYFWTYWVWNDRNRKIFRKYLETWIWSSERSGLKLWEPVTGRLLIEEQSGRWSLGKRPREEGSREMKDSERKWKYLNGLSPIEESPWKGGWDRKVCYRVGWDYLTGKISMLKHWVSCGQVLE